jgi:hypothetical protein
VSTATTIIGVTLTGGRTTLSNSPGINLYEYGGGAVRSEADLTIRDSIIAGNSTAGDLGYGGGVSGYNAVIIENSTIRENGTFGFVGIGGGVVITHPANGWLKG